MKHKTLRAVLLIMVFVGVTSAADTLINHSTSKLQLFPKVTYTSGGNYLFTWCDNRLSGGNFEIYTTAANGNLSPSSFSDHNISGDSAGHRLHCEIVPSIKTSSNDTGAIVAWVDHKAQDVFAIRVTSSGSIDLEFNDGNIKEVHSASSMTPPEMCETPDGGAIFVWGLTSFENRLYFN